MSIIVKSEARVNHLYSSVSGRFSLVGAFAALRTILDAGDAYGLNRVLLDCQALEGAPTATEYYRFGVYTAEQLLKPSESGKWRTVHLAIFGPEPPLDKGRLAHIVATNRGASTISTTNLDSALEWLANR